jgi:Abnormal spindle-like microcephaly-assoc'd, ASPM-SPD-2-Hydin
MKARIWRLGIRAWGATAALLVLASAARAQFSFSVVNGSTASPIQAVYQFPTVSTGGGATAQFEVVNTSSAAATLTLLTVEGSGYTLSNGPTLPLQMNPQASATFTVTFQASSTCTPANSNDAILSADGVSTYLTINVVPGLWYQVQTSSGTQSLNGTPINFGSVSVGQTDSLAFAAINGCSQSFVVATISASGGGFSLSGPNPSNLTLQPGNQAGFSVQFEPSGEGTQTGTLTIGTATYPLTGTGTGSSTGTGTGTGTGSGSGSGSGTSAPQISITITPSGVQSNQQASVAVNFASPATAAGSGTLTLQFQPLIAGASDPAVLFAAGGQSMPFTFNAGDTVATFSSGYSVAFQTGTTAGTITFTAQVGSSSSQQSITIPPEEVGFTALEDIPDQGSMQVQVTGFDNTRTAGQLAFTFYDANGDLLSPGTISANATSAFSQYFAGSAGGSFVLNVVFPVSGDASIITFFQVSITNSAGTSTTARTLVQ